VLLACGDAGPGNARGIAARRLRGSSGLGLLMRGLGSPNLAVRGHLRSVAAETDDHDRLVRRDYRLDPQAQGTCNRGDGDRDGGYPRGALTLGRVLLAVVPGNPALIGHAMCYAQPIESPGPSLPRLRRSGREVVSGG
jgi:hypothetical protein